MVLPVFNQLETSINGHFYVSIYTMVIHFIVITLGHLKNSNILIWSLHISMFYMQFILKQLNRVLWNVNVPSPSSLRIRKDSH